MGNSPESKFLGAASSGNIEEVIKAYEKKELAEKDEAGTLVDDDGNTALIMAAASGHLDVVKYLVEGGSRGGDRVKRLEYINRINKKGVTAYNAANQGNTTPVVGGNKGA